MITPKNTSIIAHLREALFLVSVLEDLRSLAMDIVAQAGIMVFAAVYCSAVQLVGPVKCPLPPLQICGRKNTREEYDRSTQHLIR